MHLELLELTDFRSYAAARVRLGPGVRVFVGPNAQGKTNLLEAVHVLATGASHRVASDAPLVRVGAEAAIVRARAVAEGRPLEVVMELRPGGRNRALVNGQQQPRVRDAVGRVRAVLFAPEDLELVRGDPAGRRRLLDDVLTQRRPAYAGVLRDYERVVRQRSTLLRRMRAPGRDRGLDDATLATWTDQLVRTGATVLAARIALVHALSGPAASAHADLVAASPQAQAEGTLVLGYKLASGREVRGTPGEVMPDPAELAAELAAAAAARADAERDRGVTLVGPHRDELVIELNGLPAKGYASHGETWSIALALRLASRDVLAEVGEEPVVLLDDVFAELDERRRDRLALRCEGFRQVLVTAAVDDDVPLDGPRNVVVAGTVSTESQRP